MIPLDKENNYGMPEQIGKPTELQTEEIYICGTKNCKAYNTNYHGNCSINNMVIAFGCKEITNADVQANFAKTID